MATTDPPPSPTAPTVEYPAYLDHIRRESRRFREVLRDRDPAAPVPAGPDLDAWLWHRLDRDAAGMVLEVSGDRTAYDALVAAVTEPLG